MTNSTLVACPVQVGDLIHPTSASPQALADFYRTDVGRVVRVSATIRDGVTMMPAWVEVKFDRDFPDYAQHHIISGSEYTFTGWANLTPQVGDKVRAVRPLPGAQPDWWEKAKGRTGVVTGVLGENITMRFDEPFLLDGEPWTSSAVTGVAVIARAEDSVSPTLTSSEPVLRVDTAASVEQRERVARATFERLVQAVNELAEQEEWCGQFEEWCDTNDVESTRSRDVEFDVAIDLTYTIDASDIERILHREFGGEHNDVNAEDASVTSSVNVRITCTSGDNPHDVDSYNIENALREDGYSGYSDWEITDYETV